MGLQFTAYVPTQLTGVNNTSPTLSAEAVTGLPLPSGANVGARFYLTESQAQYLTSGQTYQCHAGWYREVQVDAGATANYIAAGYIGAQKSVAKGQDVVTSVDQSLALGVAPCVFLGVVTPGNYTIVQDWGDADVVANDAVTVGHTLTYATNGLGLVADSGGTTLTGANLVGIAESQAAVPTIGGLTRCRLGFPFGQLAD